MPVLRPIRPAISEAMIASVFSPDTLTGPDVLLGYVKDKPLEYAPGTSCAYCNTNYENYMNPNWVAGNCGVE